MPNEFELLQLKLENERKLREEDKKLYTELEKEYESIIKNLEQELIQAKGKIISQKITIESFKDKLGIPIIIEGCEHDLYKGEQRDLVIGLLRNAMNNSPKYTRTYKICESLLGSNIEVGERAKIKDSIYDILKSYSGMDNDTISALSELGIKVIQGRTHYKLLLSGDERYSVSISTTPSDNKCGLNTISDINKLFF